MLNTILSAWATEPNAQHEILVYEVWWKTTRGKDDSGGRKPIWDYGDIEIWGSLKLEELWNERCSTERIQRIMGILTTKKSTDV